MVKAARDAWLSGRLQMVVMPDTAGVRDRIGDHLAGRPRKIPELPELPRPPYWLVFNPTQRVQRRVTARAGSAPRPRRLPAFSGAPSRV
jgi:hypothetical protein